MTLNKFKRWLTNCDCGGWIYCRKVTNESASIDRLKSQLEQARRLLEKAPVCPDWPSQREWVSGRDALLAEMQKEVGK